MLGGSFVGLVALSGYSALILAVLVAAGFASYRAPTAIPVVVATACAVYFGVYLTYRLDFAGFPVSILNILPVLAILAAFSVPVRERGRGALNRWTGVPLLLLAAGLVLGSVTGLANGAELYQFLRVNSTEVCLLLGGLAGLVAGASQSWQKAIVTGFYAAGLFAAAEQLISFVYLVAVGHSIWQAFPFGAYVLNVDQAILSGTIAGTRDNYLATFIMLPALTLSLYRLTARDVLVASTIILAMAVSLSRSMWIAAVLAIVLALAARALSGRMLNPGLIVKLSLMFVAVALALSTFGWGAISARIQQTGNSQDTSLAIRRAETTQAFDAVMATPQSALLGIGAGVVLEPTATLIQSSVGPAFLARGDRSSILENQLLARWTNFGLMSVFGTVALLLGGGYVAIRTLTKRGSGNDDLMALGLALPPLLAVSPFSGTLLQLNLSLPFWLLAGTVLAAHGGRREPASAGSATAGAAARRRRSGNSRSDRTSRVSLP